MRVGLVSVVDQQPPAVAGNLGPKNVVVRYAAWRPTGPWDANTR